MQRSNHPRNQDDDESDAIEQKKPVAQVGQPEVLRRCANDTGYNCARTPDRVPCQRSHFLASLKIAEQRQYGQEHGANQQPALDPLIPGLQPKPKMQSHAAVQPGDDQQGQLNAPEKGRGYPE